MEPYACYTATLQLKQLAERRLTEYHADPDQVAAWSATIDYFDDQLKQLRIQAGRVLDSGPKSTYAITLAFKQLLHV